MKDELPLWQQQCPAQAAVHCQQQMGEVLFLSGGCSGLLGWHWGSVFPSEHSNETGVVFFTSGVNEGPGELMGSSPELKPSQGNLPPRFPASDRCPRGGIKVGGGNIGPVWLHKCL